MARPAADYKILKDNTSSYNLIAHEHHVPQSPLFGPSSHHFQQGRPYGDDRGVRYQQDQQEEMRQREMEAARQRDMEREREEDRLREQQERAREQERAQEMERERERERERQQTTRREEPPVSYRPGYETIRHENHVPASPLYRGQGQGQGGQGRVGFDPRYGSPQGGRGGRDFQVPRPKDPPTPDYNTQQMHLSENEGQDTRLNLSVMRGSQEDLRDYRPNNASWAGYQDRPSPRAAPYSDRPGYGTDRGERAYRANPWTQRDPRSDIADPRIGIHSDGMGLAGSRNGGALLFIRFPVGQGENVQVAAQAFLKSKTHDNGGRFIGLAKRIFDFGYEKGPTEAMGVFHFPNMEKAFLFFQMDPIIRQPDFPPPYGHADMWIICNAYLPDNLQLFNTFLLSEVELHTGKDKREFFETFQKPFESYLYKNGAMPFVVCSYGSHDRKSLRRHNYPPTSIVMCHLFQGLEHLNWLTNDETYSKFRSLHNQMATEKCSIFTLSRDMFP